MDVLWSPWRFQYVSAASKPDGCVFCRISAASADDRDNLVVARGSKNFVVLNRFPYSTAHLLVVPYSHVPDLAGLESEILHEMIDFARFAEKVLAEVYRPAGMNVGLNLGQCAGAGIAGHIHLHIVPRWPGDANFMTTVGETRVMPESLEETWHKLSPRFEPIAKHSRASNSGSFPGESV